MSARTAALRRLPIICSISARGTRTSGICRNSNADREAFLAQLLASDRSERLQGERALFDLVMGLHAHGKPIRGEKTPAHIFEVPTLLEWFPKSKVIHTFRDPRAIFTSRKKKAEKKKQKVLNTVIRKTGLVFEIFSSLHVITNWRRVKRLDEQYRQRFPDRYILLKYEDLVCAPKATIQALCQFLGVDYSEAMLQQTMVNSSYLPDGAAGFDGAAADRWREHLDPLLNRWFILWGNKYLRESGYQL